MSRITAAVAVHVDWDDDANEWTVQGFDVDGPLEWALSPKHAHLEDNEPAYGPEFERALAHPVTAEDLAHMLGAAIIASVRESNRYVEYRPASPALIGMLKDKIGEVVGLRLDALTVGEIVQKILPVISSVDENAHRRGAALGPAPIVFDTERIRAAISDAYYEARNAGKTMEWAADEATKRVNETLVAGIPGRLDGGTP